MVDVVEITHTRVQILLKLGQGSWMEAVSPWGIALGVSCRLRRVGVSRFFYLRPACISFKVWTTILGYYFDK